jgi:hypothetical protein
MGDVCGHEVHAPYVAAERARLDALTAPAYTADRGPNSIRIYSSAGGVVATLRRADTGDDDALLRLYGWRRIGPWASADDVPAGHALAAVVREGEPDEQELARVQAAAAARRRAAGLAGQVPPHVVDVAGGPWGEQEAAVYALGVTEGVRLAARLCLDQVERRDVSVFGEGGARG